MEIALAPTLEIYIVALVAYQAGTPHPHVKSFLRTICGRIAYQAQELIRNFQQQQQKAATALLEKAKGICDKHGITASIVTEVGDPKDKICEAVEKFKVQLLVLDSHGHGVLKRAFLGSVSNYCVHNAKCPDLVVKKD